MKKAPVLIAALALLAPLAFARAGSEKPTKIAFFVSDLSNGFHQAQFAAAKKYAKEKYGADVFAFDGKSDSELMTANIDQVVAQGMDMATLHIWDGEAAKPGIEAAIEQGHRHDGLLQPDRRHRHPRRPLRRGAHLLRHGRRDGHPVEEGLPE